MTDKAIRNCLEQCLFQLGRLMDKDGLFPAVRITDGNDVGTSETLFITSLVLVLLAECGDFLKKESVSPAVEAVIRNRSRDCTWNYWPRGSASFKSEPYPDDMDDTFMALSAIALWRPEFIKKWERKILALLDARTREGLYRTWIAVEPSKNGIDVVVNATVLFYQKATGAENLALERTLSVAAAQGLRSDYYSSPAYMRYFLAKAGVKTEIFFSKGESADESVNSSPGGNPARLKTACEAALVASTLIMSGMGSQRAIADLIDIVIQSRDRNALYPIYRERVFHDGTAIEIASPALSLAACAEVCALYLKKYG